MLHALALLTDVGLTSLLITKPDFGWPDADTMLNGHFDRMLSGLLKR